MAATAVPVAGSVGAEPPLVDHFKGRGAGALLTNCEADAADGTECQAVDIFVSEESFQERGSKFPVELVSVVLYDVTIDFESEDGFVAEPVGSGLSTEVDVSVATNMSMASARATEIELLSCEEELDGDLLCETIGTMSLEVNWRATGKRETSTFHAKGVDLVEDVMLSFNFRSVDALRPATVSGKVTSDLLSDEPLSAVPLFPPVIIRTNNGMVERVLD